MDAIGRLKKINNKGVAVVLLALMIVVLVAFVGLAVDIGYMYVTKGQLQNASDAAALAGAEKLISVYRGASKPKADPNDLIQSAARDQAIQFAGKNQAARKNVVIETDNSNTISPDNDIAVGKWNSVTKDFTPNSTPVNAIKVKARRTKDAPGGDVSIFFGRVLGWTNMGAAATSTASLPVRAGNFIALCAKTCGEVTDPNNPPVSTDPSNPTTFSPPRQYDRNPNMAPKESFAWTSLLQSVSSVTEISPLICNELPNQEVCNNKIWTTQGEVASIFKDMEGAFNDPSFDSGNKEFSGNEVSAWWLYVPVTNQCNPGVQPKPLDVWGYAWVRIISVCDTGGGQPCRPYRTKNCKYPKQIVIDKIACVDCNNSANASGIKPVLVE